MVEVRLADFVTDHALIRAIRHTVFVEEQHVPIDLELDDRDRECVHVLALLGSLPVATGRIDLPAHGKIGRVAVLAEHRRTGSGSAVMHRLHQIAHEAGLRETWCNAQRSAVPFYARLGYCAVGEPFEEAGIEHIEMRRPLDSAGEEKPAR